MKPSRLEANIAADAVVAAEDGLKSGSSGRNSSNGNEGNGATSGGEVAIPPPRVPGTLPPCHSYISFLSGGRIMQQTGSMMGMNLSLWAGAWAWQESRGQPDQAMGLIWERESTVRDKTKKGEPKDSRSLSHFSVQPADGSHETFYPHQVSHLTEPC